MTLGWSIMHSGNKVQYKLQPAKAAPLLGIVLAVSLLIFLAPVVVNAVTRDSGPEPEPMVLGSYDSYEEIPLELGGNQLECAFNDLSPLMWGYDCHEVRLDSIMFTNVADAEQTLRRMVRAGTSGIGGDGEITAYGDVLTLIDDRYGLAGLAFPIDGGGMLYAQIDVYLPGTHVATYGQAMWESLLGEDMPPALGVELATLSAQPAGLAPTF